MSSSLSSTIAAALSAPVFDLDDCLQLDDLVRRKRRGVEEPSSASHERFQFLLRSLNDIANWYAAQRAVGNAKTSKQQSKKLVSIEKKARALLLAMGVKTASSPGDLPFEHFLPGAIFEDTKIEFEPLIRAVQDIAAHAGDAIRKHDERGTNRTQRPPDIYFYRVCADLGALYKDVWEPGDLTVSVNDERGGPSVRFFEYTISRISGKAIKPQTIEDAIRALKEKKIELTGVYSIFSPDGGSRI